MHKIKGWRVLVKRSLAPHSMPGNKVLHIFDFDGTLFRSPEPNPKLWASHLLGKIKSPPAQQGLGWYQELITLQAPYVHENPDESWFNPPLLQTCINSIADPNAITALLTGRQVVYEERVRHILKGMNLNFHHYGLKPGGYIFTMDFKLNFISDIIESYKGEITKVFIYEDRPEHSAKFGAFGKGLKVEFEVVTVDPNVTYLDRAMEIELVNKLIEKNSPGLQIISIPNYIGLTLDEESRKNLLSWIRPPPNWIVTAHHMTITLGNQSIEGVKLGDKGELEITHVGFDNKCLSVKVKGLPSTNPIPHVTIAHAPTAKPADSNLIDVWVSLANLATSGGALVQTFSVAKSAETPPTTATPTEPNDEAPSILLPTDPALAVPSPPTPQKPPITLQTKIPPNARLTGQVNQEMIFSFEYPPRAPPVHDPFPKGVSLGMLIKNRHPTVQGRQIGEIIRQLRTWAAGRDEVRVEEIEAFVKDIDLNNL